jgi:hypothetical protein
MAKDRRYLPPKEGGMGAIHIKTYANSLRCSWYKKINSGLWSAILMAKVDNKENCCFIRPKDINNMHVSIMPIVKVFKALQIKFLKEGGPTARINTPLDQLALIKRQATRTRKDLHFLRKAEITNQLKKCFKALIENLDLVEKKTQLVCHKCSTRFRREARLTETSYLKTVEPHQPQEPKLRRTGESVRSLGENTFLKRPSLSGRTPAYHQKYK